MGPGFIFMVTAVISAIIMLVWVRSPRTLGITFGIAMLMAMFMGWLDTETTSIAQLFIPSNLFAMLMYAANITGMLLLFRRLNLNEMQTYTAILLVSIACSIYVTDDFNAVWLSATFFLCFSVVFLISNTLIQRVRPISQA